MSDADGLLCVRVMLWRECVWMTVCVLQWVRSIDILLPHVLCVFVCACAV